MYLLEDVLTSTGPNMIPISLNKLFIVMALNMKSSLIKKELSTKTTTLESTSLGMLPVSQLTISNETPILFSCVERDLSGAS